MEARQGVVPAGGTPAEPTGEGRGGSSEGEKARRVYATRIPSWWGEATRMV